MSFIYALVFSFLTLIPVFAFAQDPADNHSLFKCNFINEQAEPNFVTVIADPEWLQVVWVTRQGEIVPPAKDVKLKIERKEANPITYIWNFTNAKGEPYVQIQEFATDPPRFNILGKKFGSFDCYRQQSEKIEYYKRF